MSPTAWYADAVDFVNENGLMNGTSDTTFSPDAAMDRSMAAMVLWRLAGSPQADRSVEFSDLPGGAWYADAVGWAASAQLLSGYGNGRFPGDPVTREQLAVILWRYEGSPWADTGIDFADEANIAPWASTAVDWARASGILNGGYGGGDTPRTADTVPLGGGQCPGGDVVHREQ